MRDRYLPKGLIVQWLFNGRQISSLPTGIQHEPEENKSRDLIGSGASKQDKYSFMQDFSDGNIALKVNNVQLSDKGNYTVRCNLEDQMLLESSANLIVIGGLLDK